MSEKKELERIKQEYSRQLEPLLYSVIDRRRPRSKAFRQNILEFTPKIEKVDQIYNYIVDYVNDISKEITSTLVFDLRHFFQIAFCYVATIEIVGNFLADFAILHLIETEHVFHIESDYRTPRMKHLQYLKELEEEKVPLATKLNFIEECGITILKLILDTKLRNDIAHMNFDVTENGIFIKHKPAILQILNNFSKIDAALEAHQCLMEKTSSFLDERTNALKKALADRKSKCNEQK